MPRPIDGIYGVPATKPVVIQPPAPILDITPVKKPRSRAGFGVAVFALASALAYLGAAPYIPSIYYAVHPPEQVPMPTQSVSLQSIAQNAEATEQVPYFGSNTITIGKIGVQTDILEGVNEDTLEDGLWRRPNSSTPELGGNTVIAGHRFKYTTGANTFYNLDKIQVGDPIALSWKGNLYTYTVSEVLTVGPKDTWVENNTTDPILTLYTCTPLWTSTKRLVVRATLQS